MPLAIRDASLTTARRRQLAIFGWRRGDNYPANPISVRAEQSTSNGGKQMGPTADVALSYVIAAQLVGQSGSCECSNEITLSGYDKKPPAC